MLIQNTGSAASAPRFTSDSAPAPVATPKTQAKPVDLPQAAVKADQPTSAQLKEAVDNINNAMRQSNSNVEFSIDKDTRHQVIKVVESKTGEVIRQFPSEEVLAISRAIDKMQQQGLLLNNKA